MQIYLYMCEECGLANFREHDRGDTYYDVCSGCSDKNRDLGSVFHKVVVKKELFGPRIHAPHITGSSDFVLQERYIFECEGLNDANRKDGN